MPVKHYILITLLSFSSMLIAQSNLKTQVDYCKSEVERLEAEETKLKGFLQVQNSEIMELKSLIMDKNREIENRDKEIKKLNENSEYFLQLAAKLEESGDYRNAMETYKLLIKCYPGSIETIASRLKVKDMTSKLIEERKQEAETKKK